MVARASRRTAAPASRAPSIATATMTARVWAEGNVPAGTPGRNEYVAVADPNRFTGLALRLSWRTAASPSWAPAGQPRTRCDARSTRAALAEVSSRPVRDWIFPILNTSQNWFAEMLLKQVGRQFGSAGSWAEGNGVVRRFMIDSMLIDSTQFAIEDGSGLAAYNLISPLAFTTLLTFIRRNPHYESSSPRSPRRCRGVAQSRFVGTPLEGRVHAKSGSISRVNSISGFVELTAASWSSPSRPTTTPSAAAG